MTDSSPFQHFVSPRLTAFQMQGGTSDAGIQDIYRALAQDEARNDLIVSDVRTALSNGRFPPFYSQGGPIICCTWLIC